MSKALVLGNGNILVCFDSSGQVKDFYFPHVGRENHVGDPYVHKIGVWADEHFHWFSDGTWNINVDSVDESLISNIHCENKSIGVNIDFNDAVYNEKNIFLRKVTVTNKKNEDRLIKVFFNNEFELYESQHGDSAFFDPFNNIIIHYKGRRVFLINAQKNKEPFKEYSIGNFQMKGKEGTFRDAEDGILSQNPVEHGSVDSVIGISLDLKANLSETFYYWITVGKTIKEVHELNKYVLEKGPEHLLRTTLDFWKAWVNRRKFNFYDLSEGVVTLYKKSLFIIRSHSDADGAIIASGDSDLLQHGKDTYGYMWPRDGAFSSIALAKAGDLSVAKNFFDFCNSVITDRGFFVHKYQADKSWGSSWHPWIRNGKQILPIQEDETALVIYALWTYYEMSMDLEFIEKVYNSLIKKAADFMVAFRDKKTALPNPSYDLWEEKFGISTFTSAAIYGALIAAGKFSNLLGKSDEEKKYNEAAEEIKNAIMKYLYDEKGKMFYKMINTDDDKVTVDNTIDLSSIYGIFSFGVLPPLDSRVVDSIETVESRLCCYPKVCGVPRYMGDKYFAVDKSMPGNPWFITTLWLAKYYIYTAKEKTDLDKVRTWLEWTVKYSLPSGVLSEQLDPYTGKQISAAPLTWSHSEFVTAVIQYLEKLEELGICKTCYPLR